MTGEHISDLKNDLNALYTQGSNHLALLREVTSILNTVASTLTAANQISAYERESMLSKLEAISAEISNERRDMNNVLARVEHMIEGLDQEFSDFMKNRSEMVDQVNETLRHTRQLVDRDPDTGAEISKSDKLIKALLRAFWVAVATAVVLMGLSKVLPWIRGLRLPAPPTTNGGL